MAINEYEFKLNDGGLLLNSDSLGTPFTDITKVSGLDSAPYRETTRDHEGADGGFIDAEFEKGRDIILEGTIYSSLANVENYLDNLKANFAPVQTPIPLYLNPGSVGERLIFVKPRGVRYDWDTARRLGCTAAQFLMYAEDPRIYTSGLINSTISYGGDAGLGFSFVSYLDTFTRTTSSGWGTSDSGNTYTLTGTAADFSTDGSKAKITLTAATGSSYISAINTLTNVEHNFYVQGLTLSATPTGGTISATHDVRVVDANNYYRAEIIFTTSNTVQVALSKVVAGTPTTLVAATTVAGLTSSSLISVRTEISEGDSAANQSILWARVWATGTAEPTAKTVESAIDGSVTATGGFRVTAVRNSGNTNTNPVVSWDSMQWPKGVAFNIDFGGGATPAGANFTNSGNRPAPVQFIITGPVINPIIFNNTTSNALRFNITLSGTDTLTINTRDRTVYLNGTQNRRNALTFPDWFFLAPGVNSITYAGQSGVGSTLNVQYRSAWR